MQINKLSAFVLSALVSTLAACSAGSDDAAATTPNNAPVIDSVDAPTSVSAAEGLYHIPVTMLWSDPDGDAIAKVRYQIPEAKLDRSKDAPAGTDSVGVKLDILASDSLPKKTYDIVFSVFDAKGLESAPITKTVSFE